MSAETFYVAAEIIFIWAVWNLSAPSVCRELGLYVSKWLNHQPLREYGKLQSWSTELMETACHAFTAAWGLHLISAHHWLKQPRTIWTDGPSKPSSMRFEQLYILHQLTINVFTLAIDWAKREPALMIVHHVVTNALIILALYSGEIRSAIVVLVIHNATDVLAGFTKMAHKLSLRGRRHWWIAEAVFALNVAAWGWARNYMFGTVYMGAYLDLCPSKNGLMTLGLVSLTLMNVVWMAKFLHIGYKLVRGISLLPQPIKV
jgi:hypothetical protein